MPRISVNFQGANGTEKQVVHRLKQIHKLVGANENAFDSSVPVVDVAVDENYIAILYANGVLQRRSIKVVVDQSVKEEKSQEKKSHKERGKSKRMRLAMGAALQAAGSTREERLRRERESRMRQFAAQDIAVPEELISQVQSILRRPRASVVRELIRSNLDVNVAVNNLLSRDEDEEYVNEDARENAESGTVPAESASSGNPPPAVNEPVDKYSGQKGEFIPNDISQFMFPEHAEWHAQFSTIQPELSSKSVVCITAMKSELVIVTADGKLHQWKWACDKPYVLQKRSNILIRFTTEYHRN